MDPCPKHAQPLRRVRARAAGRSLASASPQRMAAGPADRISDLHAQHHAALKGTARSSAPVCNAPASSRRCRPPLSSRKPGQVPRAMCVLPLSLPFFSALRDRHRTWMGTWRRSVSMCPCRCGSERARHGRMAGTRAKTRDGRRRGRRKFPVSPLTCSAGRLRIVRRRHARTAVVSVPFDTGTIGVGRDERIGLFGSG